MFPVAVAKAEYLNKECRTQSKGDAHTDKHLHTQYIENGKEDKQHDQPHSQIADILGFQSL